MSHVLTDALDLAKNTSIRLESTLFVVKVLLGKAQQKTDILKSFKEAFLTLRQFENSKCQLVEECLDFTITDAFEALDKNRQGFVNTLSLLESMDNFEILGIPEKAINSKVKQLLQFFSASTDECKSPHMTYMDFSAMVCPWESIYLQR